MRNKLTFTRGPDGHVYARWGHADRDDDGFVVEVPEGGGRGLRLVRGDLRIVRGTFAEPRRIVLERGSMLALPGLSRAVEVFDDGGAIFRLFEQDGAAHLASQLESKLDVLRCHGYAIAVVAPGQLGEVPAPRVEQAMREAAALMGADVCPEDGNSAEQLAPRAR